MKTCRKCKEEVQEGATKCKHCGADLRNWFIRHKIATAILALFILGVIGSAMGGSNEKTQTSNPIPTTNEVTTTVPEPQTATRPKAEAQKELDDLINLGKQAGLVTSYEFSDSAAIVYAGPAWYTQTVTFKKDFLAKVAMLKKEITGYQHFEVRDANSNEKVGEVTAFGGSLEVYK